MLEDPLLPENEPVEPLVAEVEPVAPLVAEVEPATPPFAEVEPLAPPFAEVEPLAPPFPEVEPVAPLVAEVEPVTPPFPEVEPLAPLDPELDALPFGSLDEQAVNAGKRRSATSEPGINRVCLIVCSLIFSKVVQLPGVVKFGERGSMDIAAAKLTEALNR